MPEAELINGIFKTWGPVAGSAVIIGLVIFLLGKIVFNFIVNLLEECRKERQELNGQLIQVLKSKKNGGKTGGRAK